MTEKKPIMLITGTYESVSAALADLDAIEQLHKEEMIGAVDAAVIDKEDGKPHVVKRMDRPRVRIIPEWFGGGTLPRKELHEAAEVLTASHAGLIAVGEPTIEKGLDAALTNAAKVVKRTVDATTDEITRELAEAVKVSGPLPGAAQAHRGAGGLAVTVVTGRWPTAGTAPGAPARPSDA